MGRRVVIVSRGRADFYRAALTMFGGERAVKVLLDRREASGGRRSRRPERRRQPLLQQQLEAQGFIVVQT